MMDISVTVVGALYGVRLEATGTTGQVDWWQDTGPENRHVGTGATVLDRDAALNRPLTYFATDDTATVVADPITVDAAMPVLASTTTQEAVPVEVLRWRPYRFEGQSLWHPVLGSSAPFVTILPALYPSATLELLLRDATQRARLIDLMRRGDPLLLRTIDPDRLDTMTVVVTGGEDPFLSDTRRDGLGVLRLEVQRVTDVPGITPPVPDRTYTVLAAQHLTYDEVQASYASYTDVLDGTAVP
jgi:hypothetical protein